jgi:hypothetical protein
VRQNVVVAEASGGEGDLSHGRQEAERENVYAYCLSLFSLFIPSGLPVCVMVPPTFRVGLTSLVNTLCKCSDTPKGVLY